MKINENLQLASKTVALVPYTREHVLPYHAWMVQLALHLLSASPGGVLRLKRSDHPE